MRNTLKEYRDEILYLRSKAMDADIKYLHLSSKVSSLAKIHFENLMVEVDPMSPILSCLRNGISGTYNAQPTSSISSRQSSRLAEEMRRSSSVVQTRRSFNSVSPIRATNTDAETQEDVEEVERYDERRVCPPQRIVRSEIIYVLLCIFFSVHESPQNTCGTLAIREEDEEGEEAEHYTVERYFCHIL